MSNHHGIPRIGLLRRAPDDGFVLKPTTDHRARLLPYARGGSVDVRHLRRQAHIEHRPAVGTVDASGHASAVEAASAHNIIWPTRCVRRRDGDVGRRIEGTKMLIEQRGATHVIEAGARKIAPHLRRAAFAVAADLVLVEGSMEPAEGRFLRLLASGLELRSEVAKNIIERPAYQEQRVGRSVMQQE